MTPQSRRAVNLNVSLPNRSSILSPTVSLPELSEVGISLRSGKVTGGLGAVKKRTNENKTAKQQKQESIKALQEEEKMKKAKNDLLAAQVIPKV